MATLGETVYRDFIMHIVKKGCSRFFDVSDTLKLGSYLWSMMSDEFKLLHRNEYKRKAFWNFAQSVKKCVCNQDSEALFSLWNHINNNSKNMWENFHENCMVYYVDTVL